MHYWPQIPQGTRSSTYKVAWSCFLLSFASPLFALPFNSQFIAVAEHDSNVSRAKDGSPKIQDNALYFVVSGDQPVVLERDWLFLWGASLGDRHWLDYSKLDETTVTARIALRRRFGLGSAAPLLRLDLDGGPSWSRTTALSGWLGNAGLTFSQRPYEWLNFGVGAAVDRNSRHDSFFSGEGATLSAFVQTTVSHGFALTLGLRQRQGTVITYAVPYSYGSTGYYHPGSLKYVDIFDSSYAAYSVLARTQGATLTANFSLGPRQSLTLGWDYSVSERGAARYLINFITLGLALQF